MPTLLDDPRIWPPQREAVATIARYLKAYTKDQTKKSALVQMPTGTGKTGVIALAANALVRHKPVLVLSPRIALCQQLSKEISHRFFDRVLPGVTGVRKKVILWEGGQILSGSSLENTVIVCTIQKLQRTFKANQAVHDRLAQEVELVLVDEGHYEPALEWRDAIRRLQGAKVIFTATPFRNDFKLFDIDFDHAFRLSRRDALAKRYIRDIQFVPRQAASLRDFVHDVVAFHEKTFIRKGSTPATTPRVIIRCDNHTTIRSIAAELRRLGRTQVAIHEQFNDDPARHEYQQVPDPRSTEAIYWIHQFKLLEGIDDPRFRLLAIVPGQELGSVRTVVQQIGRVLRNPDLVVSEPAFVLDYSTGEQEALWKNFLEYEALVDKEGIESLDLSGRLVESLRKALPALIYVDGRFRAPASLKGIPPYVELQLPRTANLHHAMPGFSMPNLAAELEMIYHDGDQIVERLILEPDLYVALHVTIDNSPLLLTRYFMEVRLCAVVITRINGMVFFLDTGGGGTAVGLPGIGLPVESSKLKRLFKRSTLNRLTGISLRGSNLSTNAIRTRSFTAVSVANTMPAFDDKASICTTAKGSVTRAQDELVSRYLGFANGKVTDSAGERVSLGEYLEWANEVADQLHTPGHALPEFTRYALETTVPPNAAPAHILLDVEEIADEYQTQPGPGRLGRQRLNIEDSAAVVQTGADGTHRFTITVNGQACSVQVLFDPQTERYHLISLDVDRLIRPRTGTESLLHYLNREQSFRILPVSPGYFYTAGQFFKPEVRFGPAYDDHELQLFKLIETHASLGQMTAEKGSKKATGTRWPSRSLFRLLDDLGAGTPMAAPLANATHVVCDDLGTEAADFIFADNTSDPPRVVFAHAKCSKTIKPCSASSLQDVCAQAAKNSKYLARFSEEAPPKMPRWHQDDWKVGKLGPIKRIRKGPANADGQAVWDDIQTVIRDWRTTKEIWLVLGNMLSRQALEEQLKSDPPVQEAIQAAMLLFSTAQAANAAGARLRVFSIP